MSKAANHVIVAGAANEGVVAVAPVERVRAIAAVEVVAAKIAVERVVAIFAIGFAELRQDGESVVPISAVKRCAVRTQNEQNIVERIAREGARSFEIGN